MKIDFDRKFDLILGASIDRPDQPPVVEESETNVDMCPNHDDTTGERPKLKKMLSLENSKEVAKQIKRVSLYFLTVCVSKSFKRTLCTFPVLHTLFPRNFECLLTSPPQNPI